MMVKCKGCKNETSEHDLLEGCYCLACVAQRVRWYEVLKANLNVALEPIRHWYGEAKRPIAHVVADIVSDLQKDRAVALKLEKQITQLNHTIAQVRDQRTNVARQLGRSEKACARLRTDNNEIFEKNKWLQLQTEQVLGKQIGWYDSDTKQFCYPDEKTEVSGLFPKPVFIPKEP